MMDKVRFIVFWMIGIQRSCFEFIFPIFNLQISILPTDDVEFTNHLRMFGKVIRIQINSHYLFASSTSPNTSTKLRFPLCTPFLTSTCIHWSILYPNESHSRELWFSSTWARYFKLESVILPRSRVVSGVILRSYMIRLGYNSRTLYQHHRFLIHLDKFLRFEGWFVDFALVFSIQPQ